VALIRIWWAALPEPDKAVLTAAALVVPLGLLLTMWLALTTG